MNDTLIKILKYLSFFWFINFGLFVIYCISIGGDAINGFLQDGIYYVANHGRYTEVSKMIWTTNRFQGMTVIYLSPIVLMFGIFRIFNPKN